jgi:hypothetical protein
MIRTSLLELFTSFVQIDKGESGGALYAYIEGPLSYSTSASDESAYLCQHGLSLWSALMQNSSSLSPHMLEMFNKNLPRIFQADLVSTDYTELRTTLSLIEGYLIIGGLDFVAAFSDTIAAMFHLTIGQVRPRAAPHAIRPVEALLLMATNSGNREEVLNYLITKDVMTILIRPCLAAMGSLSCNDDVEAVADYAAIAAHFEEFQESDIALVSYLAVCARCLLLDTGSVLACCSRVLEASPPSSELWSRLSRGGEGPAGAAGVLLKGICRLLIEKFDTFGYSKGGIWRRRLSCFALLCLYPTSDKDVLDWLPEVLYICDDVSSEAASEEGKAKVAGLSGSIISIADDDDDDEYDDDGEDKEKSPLVLRFESYLSEDPVLTYSLHDVLAEKIEGVREVVGEEFVQTHMYSSMDGTTLTRILNNDY